MREPDLASDEPQRLEKLDSLGITFSPAERRFDRITKMAQQLFEVPIALVSLVTADKQWFKSAQGLCTDQTPRGISFCGHAILGSEPLVVNDAREHPDFFDNPLVTGSPHIRFYAGQPVTYKGSNIGTLCLIDTRPRELSAAQIESLRTLATCVESELEVKALSECQTELLVELEEERREAMIEPLTGLWNCRAMNELLPRELALAQRRGSAVALLRLDIDHFKAINASLGHDTGDLVLKEVGARLRALLRPQDFVCRFGGDEFLVFLNNCCSDCAEAAAARILKVIMVEPIALESGVTSPTLSAGVVSLAESRPEMLGELLRTADMALYEAKDRGRDRAVQLTVKPASSDAA